MPELPEVETTRLGISPYATGKYVSKLIIRNGSLRWPVPDDLSKLIEKRKLYEIHRRGKYLLFTFSNGTMLLHLGMSGSLRVVQNNAPAEKHDHIDICFGERVLRYNDPRRFGCLLWTENDINEHELIAHLGPEPLEDNFNAEYLYQKSRRRSQAIKTFVMDSRIVVGVGNIYANEALFNSGVHPLKAAGKITQRQCENLANEIKSVLSFAIKRGGTTLRDFVGGDGKPGYFAQELNAYGRGGKPCNQCGKILTEKRLSNRTTVYCTACQK